MRSEIDLGEKMIDEVGGLMMLLKVGISPFLNNFGCGYIAILLYRHTFLIVLAYALIDTKTIRPKGILFFAFSRTYFLKCVIKIHIIIFGLFVDALNQGIFSHYQRLLNHNMHQRCCTFTFDS